MKPQLENGYLKIANEIIEALARHMPGFTEGQILWCVLRKTYGFNKKEDKISISQLQKMTGRSRRMIIYALQNLEAKKMILISRTFKEINIIKFNKNHSEWIDKEVTQQYKKLHLVQKVAPSATNGKKVVQHSVKNVQKVAPTINTITKDNIQKTIKATDVADTLNHLIGLFKGVNPNYNRLFANKGQREALQRQVDKFSYERIKNLLERLPDIVAQPYSPQITTPVDLEHKMGKLIIFLNQNKNDKKTLVDARGI